MAIEFNVDQALAKLGEIVATHGPQAVDLAVRTTQAEGIGKLLVGAAAAALAVGLGVLSARMYRKIVSINATHDKWRTIERAYNDQRSRRSYDAKARAEADIELPDEPASTTESQAAFVIIPGAIAVLAALVAAVRLADIWAWIAAFQPELALAHDIMQRVTGQ